MKRLSRYQDIRSYQPAFYGRARRELYYGPVVSNDAAIHHLNDASISSAAAAAAAMTRVARGARRPAAQMKPFTAVLSCIM